MSGGVRNLRAMFENKDPADPPDRGRSPGLSIGIPSAGTSPRPLSKVRTSFVTVERPGGIGGLGLKRENSSEPTMLNRRSSFSTEEEAPKETIEKKTSPPLETATRKSSLRGEVAAAKETPRAEMDQKAEGASSPERRKEIIRPVAKPDEKVAATHTNGKLTATKPVEKPVSSKTATKPAPISVAKTSTPSKSSPKKNLKAPAVPKTPTTPNRAQAKEPPAKAADSKPSKTSTTANLTPKTTSRPTTTATKGLPAKSRIQPSPPQTGFRKPRPRSPTRPVKLPASLTAHTASSGSKTSSSPPSVRRSLSRASGNSQPSSSLQAHHAVSRSPSRASLTTTKSSVGHKPSNLSKASGRSSFGPPPAAVKKQPSRASLAQQPAPADDSFLARMMRPTTSSASKLADKPDMTPPKKVQSIKRPATREGTHRTHGASNGSPAPRVKEAAPEMPAVKSPKLEDKEATVVLPTAVSETAELTNSDVAEEPAEKLNAAEVKEVAIENNTVADLPIQPKEAETTDATDIADAADAADAVHETSIDDTAEVANAAEVTDAAGISEIIDGAGAPVAAGVADAADTKTELETPPSDEVEVPEDLAIPETVKEEVEDEQPVTVSEPEKSSEDFSLEKGAIPALDVEEKPDIEEATPEKLAEAPEPEVIPTATDSKLDAVEDPEDAKAREEIARLNAEFLKAEEEAKPTQTE